jgi:hypothetical protein
MPQAIINLMYLCTQEIFLPLFPRWCLKFCQKILRLDIRIDSIEVTRIQTSVAKFNVKGVTATYTDGSTRTQWDVPFDSGSAATASSTNYAVGINKNSGSVETAPWRILKTF